MILELWLSIHPPKRLVRAALRVRGSSMISLVGETQVARLTIERDTQGSIEGMRVV